MPVPGTAAARAGAQVSAVRATSRSGIGLGRPASPYRHIPPGTLIQQGSRGVVMIRLSSVDQKEVLDIGVMRGADAALARMLTQPDAGQRCRDVISCPRGRGAGGREGHIVVRE